MPTAQKKATIDQLSARLNKTAAVYLTDYQGLTHQELENLRRKLKEQDADYTIVKNTLFNIALNQARILNPCLPAGTAKSKIQIAGPTAVLFAYQDPIKPLQNFTESFKNRLKAALVYGEYLTGKKLQRLVDLESEEVLQTKLVSQLANPLYGLACALNWNMQKLVIAIDQIRNMKAK